MNGAPLFLEAVGTRLRFDGPHTRKAPVLLVLHGGPGFDHSAMRSYFDLFADQAQVIYLDHRGNGRSGGDDRQGWTLRQWGEDVKSFCDALEIERPIVLGQSFGGMVAQAYAIAHPDHAAGLILASTAARIDTEATLARFAKAGGPEARASAERFWSEGGEDAAQDYARRVLSLYVKTLTEEQKFAAQRAIRRVDVASHFFALPDGEFHRYDFRSDLKRISCPALVISGGEGDLITPPSSAEEIVRCLTPGRARLELFPTCHHAPHREDPESYARVVLGFLADLASSEQ